MDHLFQLPTTPAGAARRADARGVHHARVPGACDRPDASGHGRAHFRPSGLLVKAVTTLDVLSGGRADLGLGAGWYEREARGLGHPVPAASIASPSCEETLRIAPADVGRRAALRSTGASVTARRAVELGSVADDEWPTVGHPLRQIMVGGGGERRTLRLVAQYADACNMLGPRPGESAPQARGAQAATATRSDATRPDREDSARRGRPRRARPPMSCDACVSRPPRASSKSS